MEQDIELEEIIKQSYALGSEGLSKEWEVLLLNAIKRFPDSPDLNYHFATAIYKKEPEKAKKLIRKCIELKPYDPWKLTLCGSLMFELNEIDTANDYAIRARDNADNDFEGIGILGHLAGRIALKKGELDFAEQALKLSFEYDPTMPTYGHELALFYCDTGRLDEALETVDKALEHRPYDEGLLKLREEIESEIDEDG